MLQAASAMALERSAKAMSLVVCTQLVVESARASVALLLACGVVSVVRM